MEWALFVRLLAMLSSLGIIVMMIIIGARAWLADHSASPAEASRGDRSEVRRGLAELERYLDRHAAFAAYLAQHTGARSDPPSDGPPGASERRS